MEKVKSLGEGLKVGPPGAVKGDAPRDYLSMASIEQAVGAYSFLAGGDVETPAAPAADVVGKGADGVAMEADGPAGIPILLPGKLELGGMDRDRMLAAIAKMEWKKSRGELVGEGYTELMRRFDLFWKWYVTMTFRLGNSKSGSVHPERADKEFRHWLDRLNRQIFGRNYKKRKDTGTLVARSTEIGSRGGLLHFHGLIGRIPERIQRVEWKETWNDIAGFARIYAYDPMLGGAAYLSKAAYAWKRGEIDFIGPWDHVEKILRESYRVPEIFAVGEPRAINKRFAQGLG